MGATGEGRSAGPVTPGGLEMVSKTFSRFPPYLIDSYGDRLTFQSIPLFSFIEIGKIISL